MGGRLNVSGLLGVSGSNYALTRKEWKCGLERKSVREFSEIVNEGT